MAKGHKAPAAPAVATANETRGEVMLTFEGVAYGLRPSWEAIEAIEGRLGKALEVLAGAGNAGMLTLHEKATIAGELIRTWGAQKDNSSAANVNDRRLKELITEEGPLLIGKRLGLVLFMAVTGGVTASGEPKPAAMTTASPPPAVDGSPA